MNRDRPKAFSVILFVVACLALFEGALWYGLVHFDSRFSSDGYRATWLRKRWKSVLGVPGPRGADLREDALLGWDNRVDLRAIPLEGDWTVNTNSIGARGTREYPAERDPRTRRFVFVGASYVYGDEVSDDESFPGQLQRLRPRDEIVNLGVSGYGLDQTVLRFESKVPPLMPDAVILGLHTGDLARASLDFFTGPKPVFELRDGALVLTRVPCPVTLFGTWMRVLFPPMIVEVPGLIRDAVRFTSGEAWKQVQAINSALLDRFAKDNKAAGIPWAILYEPGPTEIGTTKLKEEIYLESESRRLGVPFLSARNGLLKAFPSGHSSKPKHWDAEVSGVVAREMNRSLDQVFPGSR